MPQRQVEEAEGALRLAQAALQGARTRLSTFGVSLKRPSRRNPARVVLTSPISGTVVARSVYVGQWVKPSDSLFEVVNLDELWLMVFVYERELRYVKRGQAVRVGVRAYPGEVFRGTVRLVGNTLDKRTRSVAVRVVLPNRKHRLKPGMFATARIVGTHAHAPRKMLAVPWTAVQVMDGRRSVFVRVSKGVFALRKIRTGERVGKFVEVLKGLSKGDEVVTDGSFLLKGELLKSTLAEED